MADNVNNWKVLLTVFNKAILYYYYKFALSVFEAYDAQLSVVEKNVI